MRTHVVVVLETESDFPGVTYGCGPYTGTEANIMAAHIADELGVERGKQVQVVQVLEAHTGNMPYDDED